MAINQLKAGAALSYVSIALNGVIGLGYTPFMLRMMGQNEYGLYSLVASVVAYLTVLDLGFANAIVRYTAKFRAENKIQEQYEMFGMFLLLYCGIGAIALMVGMGLYFNVDALFGATMTTEDLDKIRIMMMLMVFNLAITFPMSIWGAIITAYENFVFQRLVHIARVILNTIVMVVLLYMGYKAIGMVVLLTLFNVVTLCLNAWYCRYRLCIKVKFGHFQWGFFKEVAIYSFWIFLNAIMDRIYWSTGQFVLGIYEGAAVVAIYAVAIQLQGVYMAFSTAISGVFLPRVTAMIAKGNDERSISDLFIRTGRIQFIIMAFILTGYVVFGQSFIRLWAGSAYAEAYWIALLFLAPLTVPLIQNLGIIILQARNQMKFRSLLYVMIAVGSLAVSIPLAKMYGGIGCAIGIAIALTLGQIVIMNIYYYKKIHIDIPAFWIEIGKMSGVPLLFMCVGIYAVRLFPLQNIYTFICAVGLFVVAYLPLFYFFSINRSEKELLLRPLKKILYRQ